MKEVTAEILSIGDELLIGQTINTNAGWMGGELALIGVRTFRTRVIGDDKAEILEALRTTASEAKTASAMTMISARIARTGSGVPSPKRSNMNVPGLAVGPDYAASNR